MSCLIRGRIQMKRQLHNITLKINLKEIEPKLYYHENIKQEKVLSSNYKL